MTLDLLFFPCIPCIIQYSPGLEVDFSDRRAIALQRQCVGYEAHPQVASLLAHLGDLLVSLERDQEAVKVFEQASEEAAAAFPFDPEKRLSFDSKLFRAYLRVQRREEAERVWPRIVEARALAKGPDALAEIARQARRSLTALATLFLSPVGSSILVSLLGSISTCDR